MAPTLRGNDITFDHQRVGSFIKACLKAKKQGLQLLYQKCFSNTPTNTPILSSKMIDQSTQTHADPPKPCVKTFSRPSWAPMENLRPLLGGNSKSLTHKSGIRMLIGVRLLVLQAHRVKKSPDFNNNFGDNNRPWRKFRENQALSTADFESRL